METVAFLENLAVKDVVEKETFFKRLPGVVPSLPQPVNERKVLPLLASALEFGGAPPMALSTLLKIGTSLSEEDHTKKVCGGVCCGVYCGVWVAYMVHGLRMV